MVPAGGREQPIQAALYTLVRSWPEAIVLRTVDSADAGAGVTAVKLVSNQLDKMFASYVT